MGGGLMQLVAYGAQDVYLTGNPQITFFKVVYRRHTNFSMECIQQTWSGPELVNGKCVATIARNGDLVHKMHIQLDYQTLQNNRSIADFIDYVEVEIGGQKIEKQSGAFMMAWNQLTHSSLTAGATDVPLFNKMILEGSEGAGGSKFIPLNFWFCKNAGLALPLIALQYHEVKIVLKHTVLNVSNTVTGNKLWVDYIYLDTDERRRFAQVSHEYLIEQVQEQTLQTGVSGDHKLRFNHPVKELIWFATFSETQAGNSMISTMPIVTYANLENTLYSLKLNGHERFSARPHTYFSRVQIYQHHSGDGGLNSFRTATNNLQQGVLPGPDETIFNLMGTIQDSICVYSFALNPEEHQPSGTCNFSRIDTAVFNTGTTPIAENTGNLVSAGGIDQTSRIVAINYNVLRIMSGMGGLAYSN